VNNLHQWVENMWWNQADPPLWMRALEPIYAQISRRQLERRASRSIHPALPLISVGNITAGGSGKTPFVIWLAGQLKDEGLYPVIICRGDGGKSLEPRLVQPSDAPSVVGDEALLLAQQGGCPVIAGRDRVGGANMATELGDVLILDDGFQYRQLSRSCDILLIPAEGVGNGHQIPAGPLREPLTAIQRANIIVRTGTDSFESMTKEREWHWQAKPGTLYDIMGSKSDRPNSVYAATGIARPQRFLSDLESLGLRISGSHQFPDHHSFTANDVESLLNKKAPVAVTAKDAVKLVNIWPTAQPLWVLPQQAEAETGLFEVIKQHLN